MSKKTVEHCEPVCTEFAKVHPDVVTACEATTPPIDWKCIVTSQCMATAEQLLIAAGCCPDNSDS